MSTSGNRSAVLLASLALVALLLAGCGGGSSQSTDHVSTPEDAPPAKSAAKAAEDAGEGETTATASEHQAAQRATKAKQTQDSENATAGKGKKKPAAGSDRVNAAAGVEKQLRELVKGSGSSRVVSSEGEIRRAIQELRERAKERQGSSSEDLEEALEGLLGGS